MSDQETRAHNPTNENVDSAAYAAAVQEAETKVDAESIDRAHEVHDINFRAIVPFGVALLAILLISIFSLRWLAGTWSGKTLTAEVQVVPVQATLPAAPGPGVESVPATELEKVLSPQRERLNSYGWIDKNAGTLHVPIERAMTLLLGEGLAAREGMTPTFTLPRAYQLDGSGGQEIIQ